MSVTAQHSDFSARLTRIHKSRDDMWVDPETGIRVPRKITQGEIKKLKAKAENKVSLVSFVMAILMGIVAVAVARYVRYHVVGIVDGDFDAAMLLGLDGAIAMGTVLVMRVTMGLRGGLHLIAQTAGLAVMLVAMHNLVWMFPDPFAMIYTEAWVDMVRSKTAPGTLVLSGLTIPIPI